MRFNGFSALIQHLNRVGVGCVSANKITAGDSAVDPEGNLLIFDTACAPELAPLE